MEVHAMALVLAVLLTRGLAGEEEEEEEEERGSKQQRKRTCSWTLWRCNQAPRGWRLFRLVFPWLTALLICMPCLGVAGHGMFTMDGGSLQSSRQFLADGLLVRDQEARPVTCHSVASDRKGSVAESSGSSDKAKPREFLQESELEMLPDLLAEDELVLASCMLPGGSYLRQTLRSTTSQADLSAEFIIKTSTLQDQHVAASLDWGSNSLTSASLRFLTLVNQQSSRELKVSRVFTTNTQFCTLDFQEAVVSPGSRLSIPIAYFVNSIGKAEGRMFLQTNAGWFIAETSGVGVPFLQPLLGFTSATKSELLETVFLFNAFDESISVDEAYVWVESTNDVAAFYERRGDGGVLCKRYDSELESSNPSRFKVKPKADWFLAPHSSSPIMDLSIMIDDKKYVVGTFLLKIFHHSMHLFEVLVVPMEMEWDSLGTRHAKILSKMNLVEVVAVFPGTEKENGRAWFLVNSYLLPVQGKNTSTKGQSHNGLITIFVENLLLGGQVKRLVVNMSWIYFSGKSLLAACKRLSCSAECAGAEELVNNSITHLAVRDLCSGALLSCEASRVADLEEHGFSETVLKCSRHAFCNNVDAITEGFLNGRNVHGPKVYHAQDLDGMHMSLEYYIDLLALVAPKKLWPNGSDFRVIFENLRNTCTLPFSADLAETESVGNIHGNDFNLLKELSPEGFAKLCLFFHNSKSVCAWPGTVVERNICAWILDSSELRGTDASILYTRQESDLKESQRFSCIATYGMGLKDFANCGLEYSKLFFCCRKLLTDFLEDFLEKSVVEDCFEAHCAPTKSILAVFFPQICHTSPPFSRYQKQVLKLSFLIVFFVFVMIVKALRRERQFASDFRLQHSCSHAFFVQSVSLKSGCIEDSKSSSHFEHVVASACSREYQNGDCYENRFLAVKARVLGGLGSMFRSFFDLQAMVLNVGVHISESPQAVAAEQNPEYPKNRFLADQNSCNIGQNRIENPGRCQIPTAMQELQENGCTESIDVLRATHLEAGTLPLVSSPTTLSTKEDVSSIRSVGDLEKVQHKEKKEKGKRRKRRSNIIDLKQKSERTGQSGSSSPPSSPASPATPLANSPISPFRQSNSPVGSLKGSTHLSGQSNTSSRDPTPRSTLIQISSEMLSQLDVRANHDQACNSAIKERLHRLCSLGSKASLEPLPSRMAAAVKTEFCGKGSVRVDTRKEASASENWAAVARRSILISSDEDQCQRQMRSLRSVKDGVILKKPVLLPLATFPQSGRSMQWNHQKLEERNFILNDPTSSPSLISTSLVAPDARAPGSRSHYNEKLPVNIHSDAPDGQLELGSTVVSTDYKMNVPKTDTSLYDIWGDHFAEINCRNQADLFSSDGVREHNMVEITSPAFPKMGSLFAASELMASAVTPESADATMGHSNFKASAGFSVFSHDTFFSPHHCKDAAGSPTP